MKTIYNEKSEKVALDKLGTHYMVMLDMAKSFPKGGPDKIDLDSMETILHAIMKRMCQIEAKKITKEIMANGYASQR